MVTAKLAVSFDGHTVLPILRRVRCGAGVDVVTVRMVTGQIRGVSVANPDVPPSLYVESRRACLSLNLSTLNQGRVILMWPVFATN